MVSELVPIRTTAIIKTLEITVAMYSRHDGQLKLKNGVLYVA